MSAEAYRWRCSCCGEEFTGLPLDLAFGPPVDWASLSEEVRQVSRSNDDFCEVHYSPDRIDRFIRCILPLPVPRIASEFRFGVWMSVSERSWDIYWAGFDTEDYSEDGCFGYLMHEIPEYLGSHLLHADVWFRNNGQRPRVELQNADHPLVRAQRDGIDVTQIERWVAISHQK